MCHFLGSIMVCFLTYAPFIVHEKLNRSCLSDSFLSHAMMAVQHRISFCGKRSAQRSLILDRVCSVCCWQVWLALAWVSVLMWLASGGHDQRPEGDANEVLTVQSVSLLRWPKLFPVPCARYLTLGVDCLRCPMYGRSALYMRS